MTARERFASLNARERPAFETAVMKRCPQFQKCAAPLCPLDPLYEERGKRQPGEEKCRAQKPTRLRIVAEALAEGVETAEYLPHGGLTPKEFSDRERGKKLKREYDALPEAEKQKVQERLAAARRKSGQKRADRT